MEWTKKYEGEKNINSYFFVCTILPGIPYIFDVEDIGRRWWQSLYPITYYFIGAYIREYGLNISIKTNGVLLAIWILFWNSINFYKSYGDIAETTLYIQEYFGIVPFVTSLLLFLLILHIKIDKLPKYLKRIIIIISELSFGMYLISWIIDSIFYPKFNDIFPIYSTRVLAIGIVVPFIFVCSAICSALLNVIVKGRKEIMHYIENKIFYINS